MKVELDLSNYATKGIDTLDFAKKTDLANLKSHVDKLNIDNLKNIPSYLKNLKGKGDRLDVDKLVPVPVDSSKVNDVVKNDIFKKRCV